MDAGGEKRTVDEVIADSSDVQVKRQKVQPHVENWNVAEVGYWLEEIGLSMYKAVFVGNHVNGLYPTTPLSIHN